MSKPTIIAFPGWGCTLEPITWFDQPIRSYSHIEQMRAFIGLTDIKAMLPKDDWILVTWSMGAWMGLELSKIWKRPPKHWLALSPFIEFLAEDSKIEKISFERLLSSFDEDPKRTLNFFMKQNGAFESWCDSTDFRDVEWLHLKKTLHYLGHHPPETPSFDEIPVTSVIGTKDRLVSESMAKKFSSCFKHHQTKTLQNLNHALFYEEPDEVGTIFKKILS